MSKKKVEQDVFSQENVTDNIFIRTFKSTVKYEDLKWHRDYNDRFIEILNENDWYIQFDNCLPIPLKENFEIKKGVYHRLIKGTTDLVVKITEQ